MGIAERMVLSPEERSTLEAWEKGRRLPLPVVQRARIIRLAADGMHNQDVAKEVGVSCPTVPLWKQRFLALRLPGLQKDAPRPGPIARIRARKIRAVVEATLPTTPPEATPGSTRARAQAQGLSEATIRRMGKQDNLQPHRGETFHLRRDKRFLEKLPDLVGLYRNPPDKELVLCVDEKSPIQALDRTQPLLPLRAGIAARQTHDDKRNGTPPLFAAWRRLDGKLIGERTHSPASDRGWHVTPGFICILSRPRVPGCTGSNAGSAKSPTNGCVEEPLHVNGL